MGRQIIALTALITAAAMPAHAATLTTIASFNGANGYLPAGLFLDPAGNLFGTTGQGGAFDRGTVFRIDAGSNAITTIASFSEPDAYFPSGVVADASGNLYGTTAYGGPVGAGAVFRVDAGSNVISPIAYFVGTNGEAPNSGVIIDAAGNLFGTTVIGGPGDKGTVFRIDAGTNTITTLASFSGPNGGYPYVGLTKDAAGNLFGIASGGYEAEMTTVFRIDAGSTTLTTLASFARNGSEARPVLDPTGNIYGSTSLGGASGMGSIFRLDAGSDTITTLVSFSGADGYFPSGGLIIDAVGNLFGTTAFGGTENRGTVFRIDAGSSAITTLASFSDAIGAQPTSLTVDAAGNLYGTTPTGGSTNNGTVFRISDAGFVTASGVPEPATWAQMIAGMAIVGIGLRRRSRLMPA